MSNVYSIGNNRQLIIYATGSNIFLRLAYFGGIERPIVLATDYISGLDECIYNDTLYYTYISSDNSLIIRNIMDNQNIYMIHENELPKLHHPSIGMCNNSLLLFYLKSNPINNKNTLHCTALTLTADTKDIDSCPVPLPSCVTDISDYRLYPADNNLLLYINNTSYNRIFYIEEIGHIKELKTAGDIAGDIKSDIENNISKNYEQKLASLNKKYDIQLQAALTDSNKKLTACQDKITEQAAIIDSITSQYNELMNVACQYRDEAVKWRSKFM